MLMYITGAKGILRGEGNPFLKVELIFFFSFRGLFTTWYSLNEGHIFHHFFNLCCIITHRADPGHILTLGD